MFLTLYYINLHATEVTTENNKFIFTVWHFYKHLSSFIIIINIFLTLLWYTKLYYNAVVFLQSSGVVNLKEISQGHEKVVHKPIKSNSEEDLVEQKELEDGEVHTKLKRTNEPLGFIEKQFKNLSTYGERRKTII